VVLIADRADVDRAEWLEVDRVGRTARITPRAPAQAPAPAPAPAPYRSAFDWDDLPRPRAIEPPRVPVEPPGPTAEGRALRLLRRGLIAQTVLGSGVAAFTLATESYWPDAFHPLAWSSLGVLLLGLLLALLPDGRGVVVARILAGGVIVVALFGVVEHVLSNYGAGPADPQFGQVWMSMPALTRWGLAITKGVGDAPTLAPIALGQVALALLLITLTGPRNRDLDGS
jgi:hypothetical protein